MLVAKEKAGNQHREGEISVLLVGEGHSFLVVMSAKIDNLAKIEQNFDHRASEVESVAEVVDMCRVRRMHNSQF